MKRFSTKREVWKDIPGYEGYYQASDKGRIKSLEKLRKTGNGGIRCFKEKILKPSINTNGYYGVLLYKEGVRVYWSVHVLIAMCFHNHVPCGKKWVVNHKDFDKLNNWETNLEVVSMRENSNKKHLKSSSKYVGVYWYGRYEQWNASISYKGKRKNLGYFDTEKEAHKTYQMALNKLKKQRRRTIF